MLDFYMEFPAWVRTMLAFAVLAIGVTMVFVGHRGRPQWHDEIRPEDGNVYRVETETPGAQTLFRFGMVVSGVGTLLLCVAGKSSAEKNGYRF